MIKDMKVKTERTIFIELDEPRIEDHFYNGKRIAITSIKLFKRDGRQIDTAEVQGTFVKADGTIGKAYATSLYVARRIMPAWLLGIVEDVDRFIRFEPTYPEHEKMAAVRVESEAISQFLDTTPYILAEMVQFEDREDPQLVPVAKSINQILAAYFDIDLDKIEQEKRAMLDQIRSRQ